MTFREYEMAMLALCAWREARGEGEAGMLAVMCVVRNRVRASIRAMSYSRVIWEPLQFSAMTAPRDPELCLSPAATDQLFVRALQLAEGVYSGVTVDNTCGATHYFNPGVVRPDWALSMTQVAVIGHHVFYR